MKKILFRFLFIFLLAIVTFAPAQAAPWQAKVSPQVIAALQQGEAEFLVVLAEQADLGPAASLSSKPARGEMVYRTLTELAARTQPPVLAILKDARAEYGAYWIANLIWVRGDVHLVQTLARRADVAYLAANPSVSLDLPPQPQQTAPQVVNAIEWNILKVNADDAWSAGFTGQGVVVAGQDTGYDWDHPALINQYRGWNGATANHDYNWHDAIHVTGSSCGANSLEPCDDHGHGTHTMGTMVGDDGGSNQIGMAPEARWIGCRNMNNGNGTPQTYTECFQWFVAPTKIDGSAPRPDLAPDVINNSWGCPPSEGCDAAAIQAMQLVVENVRAAGILVVASAGNNGSSCNTVDNPPGIYDAAFSVGATDSADNIAGFSSRGPADYTGLPKPDVSAPGVGVRSSVPGGGYGSSSGTSMAAPHVAGQVALLISAFPALRGDVDNLEKLIRDSALPRTSEQTCGGVPGSSIPNNTYGWGRIDAWAAYQLAPFHALSIKKHAPVVVSPEKPITYTLTVTHDGYLPTHAVILTDTLPLHTSFVTATLPYTRTNNVITWLLGDLATGTSASVTLVVQPDHNAPKTITNDLYGVRSLEVTQTVSGPPVTTTILDHLSLAKQAPTSVDVGAWITYTLTITNNHLSQPSRPLVLTDTIPANTSFITATLPHTLTGNLVTWDFAALFPGDVQTVTLTVQAPEVGGLVINHDYALRTDDFSVAIIGQPVETRVSWRLFFPFLTR